MIPNIMIHTKIEKSAFDCLIIPVMTYVVEKSTVPSYI
jgi:hypothetical protein